jgi:hypothetical protein
MERVETIVEKIVPQVECVEKIVEVYKAQCGADR